MCQTANSPQEPQAKYCSTAGAHPELPDPHAHVQQKQVVPPQHDIPGAIITVSDRCIRGDKTDQSGPLAQKLLAKYRVQVSHIQLVPDGIPSVQAALQAAIQSGARFILTTGGTGITERDLTVEATEPLLETKLDAIAWQIAQQGLAQTPLACLSRGLVGITGRGKTGVVIANAPGSRGGVKDTISVLGPLLPHLFEQLDPEGFPLPGSKY